MLYTVRLNAHLRQELARLRGDELDKDQSLRLPERPATSRALEKPSLERPIRLVAPAKVGFGGVLCISRIVHLFRK